MRPQWRRRSREIWGWRGSRTQDREGGRLKRWNGWGEPLCEQSASRRGIKCSEWERRSGCEMVSIGLQTLLFIARRLNMVDTAHENAPITGQSWGLAERVIRLTLVSSIIEDLRRHMFSLKHHLKHQRQCRWWNNGRRSYSQPYGDTQRQYSIVGHVPRPCLTDHPRERQEWA